MNNPVNFKYIDIFDNVNVSYDLEKYPMDKIILREVQKYYPDVQDLSLLHEYVEGSKVSDLMAKVSKDLTRTEFYEYFDEIVKKYVGSKIDCDILIQKFGNVRAVIPNQDKIGALLCFHQGRWVGNGLGLRTVWMAFTDCYETNTLQMLPLDKSREITINNIKENWSYEELQKTCTDYAFPVTIKSGQFHLFTQEHIHGNFPNKTNKTRISIDVRILLKDGQPHRKWPGAYFRKLGDLDINSNVVEIKPEESTATYAEYEGFKTKYIDLHFQTLTVRNYCNRMGYTFPYQHADNEGTNHAHLEHLIIHGNIDHLFLFSIFSLPDNSERRQYLMNLALKHNCKLHFANEEFVLDNQKMLDKIEYLRTFTDDWTNPVDQVL
jgi:sporadic carbohydrate cluster 2OG-Fe(II) oxygenase/sporadic carbohydrate cluster protein (TIGR04323 family)